MIQLEDLVRSTTAKKYGILNLPNDGELRNLLQLTDTLNYIQDNIDIPIKITSGFRCKQLNKVVGGSSTSAHLTGNAVDFKASKGSTLQLFKKVATYLLGNDFKFDQLILERSNNVYWIHLGMFNNSGVQRCQVFGIGCPLPNLDK